MAGGVPSWGEGGEDSRGREKERTGGTFDFGGSGELHRRRSRAARARIEAREAGPSPKRKKKTAGEPKGRGGT